MLLGDTVPFVPEKDHGALSGGFQARERDRTLGEFDGDDLPAVGALLLDPAVLACADPVDARMAAVPEGVAVGERLAVVRRVRDGDAGADGVARA